MPLPNIHNDQAYEELALDIITSPFCYDGESPVLPGQPKRILMVEDKPLSKKYFDEVSKTQRPDIQSETLNLGIEVTMAIDFNNAQDMDTFDKAKAQDIETFKKNITKIDKKNQFKSTIQKGVPGVIPYGIYVNQPNTYNKITESINKKNNKAGAYRKFKDNWLFIFCPFILDEEKILKAIKRATNKKAFNVYVFASLSKLQEVFYVYSPYTEIEKRHHYDIGEEI